MREWALHIMDLIENSLRAGASAISVTMKASTASGVLQMIVEDDGPGLGIPLERAGDPFYTTKSGKAVGLGLSLFRAAVEEAGGVFQAEKPDGGGLRIAGVMPLAHVDRKPIGDLAETLWTMAVANPDVELLLKTEADGIDRSLSWRETRTECNGASGNVIRQARHFAELARQALSDVEKIEQRFNGFERKGKE